MKPAIMLTVTSLVSILLLSLHITEDIVLGFSGGGLENLFGIAILVVYLCGTLLLSHRRSGLIIVLLGSIIAAGMPVIHMTGAGVGVKRSAGAFFFVWTLYALGVSGTFGIILSALALRRTRGIHVRIRDIRGIRVTSNPEPRPATRSRSRWASRLLDADHWTTPLAFLLIHHNTVNT